MKEKTNRKKLFAGLTIALVLFTLFVVIIVALPKEENGTKNLSIQERLTLGYWYARDPGANNKYQATEYTFFDDGTYRIDDGIVSPADGSYGRNLTYGTYTIEDDIVTINVYDNSNISYKAWGINDSRECFRILSYSDKYDTLVWSEQVEHQNMQKAINSPTPLTYDEIIELIDTHQFYLNEKDIPITTELSPITDPEDLIVPAVNFFKYGHCCDVQVVTDEKTLKQINALIPQEYKTDSYEIQEVVCQTCKSKENVMEHIENCIVTEKPSNLPEESYYFDTEIIGHKIKQNQIIIFNNNVYLVVSESDSGPNYNKYNSFAHNLYNEYWNAPNIDSDRITLYSNNSVYRITVDFLDTNDTYKIIRMREFMPEE